MLGKATLAVGGLTGATGLAITVLLTALSVHLMRSEVPNVAWITPVVSAFAPVPEEDAQSLEGDAPTVGYVTYAMRHRIEKGDTLGGVLMRAGISAEEARAAVDAMRGQFDPRRLRAGQELTITIGLPGTDDVANEMKSLTFDLEFPYRLVVDRDDGGQFHAWRDEKPVKTVTTEAAGTIRSSLFQAGADAKIPPAVIAEMIRMFSWDVDFQRDIRRGDRFSVLYDRYVDDAGATVKSGAVAAAALVVGGEQRTIYRYVDKSGDADFYTADGRTARKALLRTPIDGARLSSGFGRRRHPILGYTKFHKGVDFAAPTGTPIYAAGDGTVDFVGRRGGYGKYVRVKHRSGYKTAYAHMSRYAKSMRKGRKVKQGQVIGYVGTTGRSTGPHLHYEVLKNNRHINPMKVKTLPGRKLAGADLKRFKAQVADQQQQLAALIKNAGSTVVARAGE